MYKILPHFTIACIVASLIFIGGGLILLRYAPDSRYLTVCNFGMVLSILLTILSGAAYVIWSIIIGSGPISASDWDVYDEF